MPSSRLRKRERTIATGSNTPLYSGGGSTTYAACVIRDECSDVVGNIFRANPLSLVHFARFKWLVTGRSRSAGVIGSRDLVSYPASSPASGVWYGSKTAIPTDNQALSEGLARTNPNRADVDLPVFLFELREIPRMLKDWGDDVLTLMERATYRKQSLSEIPLWLARKQLETGFGLNPLLSDTAKLLHFVKSVESRFNRLRNMGNGLSVASATVWQDSSDPSNWIESYTTALYYDFNRIRYRYRTDRRWWTSTNWKSLVDLPSTDMDRYKLAVRLALGLDISFATLWEAMPWSWLIDWFSNLGDIFNANRQGLPVSHSGSCLMKHTTTSIRSWEWVTRQSGNTYTLTFPPLSEAKERVVTGEVVYPEFDLPVLSGDQLSILFSLGIVRDANRYQL